MRLLHLHDLLAAIVAVGLLVFIAVAVLVGRDVPEFVQAAFGAAIGYVFGAQVQRMNNY